MNTITEETRREGLEHIEPKAKALSQRILEALASGEATANEISLATEISLNNVRSRLTELSYDMMVAPCGKKINPASGIKIAVWHLL